MSFFPFESQDVTISSFPGFPILSRFSQYVHGIKNGSEKVGRGNLTVSRVEKAKEPGRYADGDCLFLVVTKTGSKQWVARVTIHGRQTDLGLGGVSYVIEPPVRCLDRLRSPREVSAKSF